MFGGGIVAFSSTLTFIGNTKIHWKQCNCCWSRNPHVQIYTKFHWRILCYKQLNHRYYNHSWIWQPNSRNCFCLHKLHIHLMCLMPTTVQLTTWYTHAHHVLHANHCSVNYLVYTCTSCASCQAREKLLIGKARSG